MLEINEGKERDVQELFEIIKTQISKEKYSLLAETYESIQELYKSKISLLQTEEEIKIEIEIEIDFWKIKGKI